MSIGKTYYFRIETSTEIIEQLMKLYCPPIIKGDIPHKFFDDNSDTVTFNRDWLENYENRMQTILDNSSRNQLRGSEIESKIFNSFILMLKSGYKLSLKDTFNIDFWNSLTLSSNCTLELIKLRWSDRSNGSGVPFLGNYKGDYAPNYIRRFVVRKQSDLDSRHTIARMWIMANLLYGCNYTQKYKILHDDLVETAFKQLDLIEYILGTKIITVIVDENENILSPILYSFLEVLREYDKKKDNGEVNFIRQNLTRSVFSWLARANNLVKLSEYTSVKLKELVEDIFQTEVEPME